MRDVDLQDLAASESPRDWIRAMRITLRMAVAEERFPTSHIAESVAMMGVEDPDSCGRENGCPLYEYKEGSCRQAHREFNTKLWSMLHKAGCLDKLRRFFQRDLRTDAEPGFGPVLRHDYCRDLLDNFLTERPTREWVIYEGNHPKEM